MTGLVTAFVHHLADRIFPPDQWPPPFEHDPPQWQPPARRPAPPFEHRIPAHGFAYVCRGCDVFGYLRPEDPRVCWQCERGDWIEPR